MRNLALAALAAAALAVPAQAQDAAPFTGPRVEAMIGYDSATFAGDGIGGLVYGVGAGFDFQAGAAVLGIEAEISNSEADECSAAPGGSLCTDTARDLYIGARAGGAIGPAMLVYAKAGYTNARLKTDYSTGVVGAGSTRSFDLGGVRVGAGAEFALGPNAFVKTEYRYSNYGEGGDIVGGTALNPVRLPEETQDKHQILAGFGFRF